jgi:serine protease SohB
MNFLTQYGLFVLETVTFVIAVLILFAGILSLSRQPKPKLTITSLNKEWSDTKQQLQKKILGKKHIDKPLKKKQKQAHDLKPKVYVIDFTGDIKASQVDQLRDEITAILTVATPVDEVVVRLESPGGSVNGYGLAASQLQRIRDNHIPLTVCIDRVAASGGYLMACIAQTIIAAPFAIIGSIGVVAQIPNFHRFLRKKDIDFELLTAGEFKRTLTLFGENTNKGREKFQEDLEKIHETFKDHVLSNRHQLNINEVATGEHWLGQDAIKLQLIDVLQTSDDYLTNKIQTCNVYQVTIHAKQTMMAKLLKPTMKLMHPWA